MPHILTEPALEGIVRCWQPKHILPLDLSDSFHML